MKWKEVSQCLCSIKTASILRWWWCRPLIPVFGRQRQVDFFEFEASLVYRASSRTSRAVTQRNPVLKIREKKVIFSLFILFILHRT